MNALMNFWQGMLVHLWQTTLILFFLLILQRGLSKAPARVSHTLWSIALLKIFLPLSLFGSVASVIARGMLSNQYGILAELPAVATVVANPLGKFTFSGEAAGFSLIWIIIGITVLWGMTAFYQFAHIARDLHRSRRHGGKDISTLNHTMHEKLRMAIETAGIPISRVLCTQEDEFRII